MNYEKKIFALLVGIAVSTQSFAEFSPLCKATYSKRTFQDAVNLINDGADVNEPCSNGFKGALPLDIVISHAAINSKAPELAALLLSKGAVVGGEYRKDIFMFLDPKRQQEFDTKAIAAPFAITPGETEYAMRKYKELIDQGAEAHAAEFRERARKQDAALFSALGTGVAAVAGAAITYQVLRNSGSDKAAAAIPSAAQQVHAGNVPSNAGVTTIPGGNTGATNVANTEKAKTYLCPQRESFTSSIHYLNAKVETFTFEEACARAQQQASEFVGRLGRNQTGYGNNMKVKNIEACRKTNHDEEAVVHVNMEEPSSSACGTTSGGMAR